MTENEAKKKWCPMARHGEFRGYDGGDPYAISNAPGESKCIASACMMWREDLTREEAQNGFYAKNGHCGLRGLP